MNRRRSHEWSKYLASVLGAAAVMGLETDAFALAHLSIGSAHASETLALTSNSNGLEYIDWHMHNCAFKSCFPGEQPLNYSIIEQIMDTRGAMTMETDQEQYQNGWEEAAYDAAVAHNHGKPIGNYVVTVRPSYSSWDESYWIHSLPSLPLWDCHAIPGEFLSPARSWDSRAVYHYIPGSAAPTSGWTPYQQTPEFPWGDYINVNAGVTLDMPGYMYLQNHVPLALALAGWTGAAWKAHIISMFNQESGQRNVHINMTGTGQDTVQNVKAAMEAMLADGMQINSFIVVNFSVDTYAGGTSKFVADMNEIADHFFYLRYQW